MHICEGILAGTPHGQALLLAGAAAAAAGTAIGLRRLDYDRVPQVAVLSAAFFVASLIHVPLGPTSVHLVLGGLLGLVLGWAAVPAVLVALTLQAVFFSFGGLTTLGLNTVVMALPAVACYHLFHSAIRNGSEFWVFWAGFAAGATAIVLGALLTAAALLIAGKEFETFSLMMLAGYLPLALVDGFVTGSVVVLVRKVRPELLNAPLLAPLCPEMSDA
jgi:cobalt/nickel transport system permease protein